MPILSRRHFLTVLGFGAGAAAAASVAPALIAVPERKIWQVPRNAPVGEPPYGINDVIRGVEQVATINREKWIPMSWPLELNAEQGMTFNPDSKALLDDDMRQFFVPFEPTLHPNSSYLAESMAEQDRLMAELKTRFDRYRKVAASRVARLLRAQQVLIVDDIASNLDAMGRFSFSVASEIAPEGEG